MPRFCTKCGEQVQENTKFCAACGYATGQPSPKQVQPPPVYVHLQQYQQNQPPPQQYAPMAQYQQPPGKQYQQQNKPTSAKVKNTFIIVGVGVVVVALAIVFILTNIFGLFGKNEDGDTGNGNSASVTTDGNNETTTASPDSSITANTYSSNETIVNVPDGASADELLAFEYISLFADIYQLGVEYDALALPLCADCAYALSASSISAMRYAIECLLESKGTKPDEDDRLRNWDDIASLGWSSHYPFFFEGIVLEAQGDTAGALECYRKAILNPNYTEEDEDLKAAMQGMDEDALNGLKVALVEIEDIIFEAANEPMMIVIERNEYNFDVVFLHEKAAECMALWEAGGDDAPDALDAYAYYLAAIQIDPLDGDNYADLVEWALRVNSVEATIYSIDTVYYYYEGGLLVDPGNIRLAALTDEVKEAREW